MIRPLPSALLAAETCAGIAIESSIDTQVISANYSANC
jgi:hypothetical protein